VQKLLTKTATSENVENDISKAAKKLESGDIFLLSYSGHGGKLPDRILMKYIRLMRHDVFTIVNL